MDEAPIPSSLHVAAAVKSEDAGSLFVLESKGSWLHAGYHLTGATAGPALLSLPFAFAFIGWGPGVLSLLLGAGISFYAYYVLITVLENLESQGKRFVRYRDLADHVLGKKWSLFLIGPLQFTICFVTVIAAVLVGGVCMKEIYMIYNSNGSLKLYQFILIFGAITATLAQLPSFHSLRHVNFLSLLLCLGYSLCATCGSIIAGLSPNAPVKSYTINGDVVHKVFGVFGSLAIIANSFGNAIIAEIQVYLQPAFEVLEAQFVDVEKGRFSIRNMAPRILGRTLFVGTASFFAAMLPFFGDINALMGAMGYTPIVFVFPIIFSIIVFKTSKISVKFWFHIGLIFVFSLLTVLGSLAAIGQLSLDASKFSLFANDIISS